MSIIRYQQNCSYKNTPFNDFMFHSLLDTVSRRNLAGCSSLEEPPFIFLKLL